ncbi:hypothetical protein [Paenibacillus sp. FSL H7-0331]|uniref:hypothetical protein n=2 Tax=Paenibacillus sp. FSL H7-0331 TaxID=1920421 RepID=UPI000970073C|nr:hypothetical protein [Paenibacillus sp. FSL H7-0331]OMF00883.1 hypothetical protein BK127_37785 [Paenibacillus sp. FSL H7-0331]
MAGIINIGWVLMFELRKVLEEIQVPLSYFIEKLSLKEEEVFILMDSNDSEAQMELYFQFITAVNDDDLLPRLVEFFTNYVEEKSELVAFITNILKFRSNNSPRRMINSVERLVSLADDMDVIRKGKHSLKIFYFVVCIETLYSLADIEMNSKSMIIIDFFNTYIEEADAQFIIDNIRRSLGDDRYKFNETVGEYKQTNNDRWNTEINMEIFARVINELRNIFAHEGDYWGFHFTDSDTAMLNTITVAENQREVKLKRDGKLNGLRRVYEVKLTYEQFKAICVRGFLNFINTYFKSISS